MTHGSTQERFAAALDALVEQVKADRTVLAAILCGSLSHDAVWAKSDIDLVLVTTDEKRAECSHIALNADGVNVHALLTPRASFRRVVEGSRDQSFMRSFLAKGRLLYTHDQSIADLCERVRAIGERDTEVQLLSAAMGALPAIDKARKWLVTRGDLDYSALWMLYAATPLAQIEVIGAGQLADREVIPQAMKLNPAFFRTIYTDLLNGPKSRPGVQAALDAIDAYVWERAPRLFGLVIDHLREVGEARSCTEIDAHFSRTFDLDGVTGACEYLADRGVVGKASAGVRLTRTSNVQVQELAFFYIQDPDAG
jgi:predicted nucleotidyltransferase